MSLSVTGASSAWPTIAGPPASRAIRHTTAAMPAPALHPPTTSRSGMPPSSSVWSATQRTAATAVVGRGGEAVLRARAGSRPTRRSHRCARTGHGTDGSSDSRAAQHPAAAVEVQHHRVRARSRRPVQPVGEGSRSAGEVAVDHLTDRRARRVRRDHPAERGTRVGGRHRLQRRQVQRRDLLEHHLDVGLQSAHHAVVALRPPAVQTV